jgi:hypothetical protein
MKKPQKKQPKGVQYVRPALWLCDRFMPLPCKSEAKSEPKSTLPNCTGLFKANQVVLWFFSNLERL